MPDHRIGLTLDVRNSQSVKSLQNDFDNVAKSAADIKEQFKSLDSATSDLVRRGWGSREYTQELQNQLRMMQTMANLVERRARRAGNMDVQGDMRSTGRDIRTATGDVNSVRNISQLTPAQPSLSSMGRTALGGALNSLVALAGLQGGKLLYGGWNANLQMLPTFANMGQTMAPNGGNMAWAQSMLRAGQGYGYTNPQILAGAQTIQAAAGNTPQFFNQIRGVAQFGRYNGFDYGQAANYFSGAYQSGVTGGTGAQMSWQQYAILVANTVNAGNMQGRNGQVVSALQQMTQMAQQSMVNAPNQNQIGQLYATATKGGNQAAINQFPNMMSGLNSAVTNPGYGAFGQAWMLNAVAPNEPYWKAKYIMSQGIFGNNGKSFPRVMNAAAKLGNNYKGWDMVSGISNGAVSPTQVNWLMSRFIKNGKFDETSFSNFDNGKLSKAIASGNQGEISKILQNMVAPGQSAQNFTSNLTGAGGWLYNSFLGNPGGMIGGAFTGAYFGGKALGGLRSLIKGVPKGTITPPPSAPGGTSILGPNGEVLSTVGAGGEAAGAGLSGAAMAGTAVTAGGALLAATTIGPKIGQSVADFLLGHKKGQLKSGNMLSGYQYYSDTVQPGWEKLFGITDKRQGVTLDQKNAGTQFNASKAAEETAAIIVALKPYMGQIDQALGSGNTNLKNTNTSLTPGGSSLWNSPVSMNPGSSSNPLPSGGNWFSSLLGGANTGAGRWAAGITGSPYTGVNQYLGQINADSSKYGVPAQVLAGIMQTESGGNPYSVNVNATKTQPGISKTFGNEKDYQAFAQQYINAGRSVDMGPMQINSGNGVTPAQAADPNFALNFASNMLKSSYQHGGSWDYATRAYNQGEMRADAGRGSGYLSKVKSAEGALQAGNSASKGQSIPSKSTRTINANITIKDPYGSKLGSTMLDLTKAATMNGQ